MCACKQSSNCLQSRGAAYLHMCIGTATVASYSHTVAEYILGLCQHKILSIIDMKKHKHNANILGKISSIWCQFLKVEVKISIRLKIPWSRQLTYTGLLVSHNYQVEFMNTCNQSSIFRCQLYHYYFVTEQLMYSYSYQIFLLKRNWLKDHQKATKISVGSQLSSYVARIRVT